MVAKAATHWQAALARLRLLRKGFLARWLVIPYDTVNVMCLPEVCMSHIYNYYCCITLHDVTYGQTFAYTYTNTICVHIHLSRRIHTRAHITYIYTYYIICVYDCVRVRVLMLIHIYHSALYHMCVWLCACACACLNVDTHISLRLTWLPWCALVFILIIKPHAVSLCKRVAWCCHRLTVIASLPTKH